MFEWIFITSASAFAGFIDAVVGGGGLILVPALFATFPTNAPATLLGTNKSASIWGTIFSAWKYKKKIKIPLYPLVIASLLGGIGALVGAWVVTVISPEFLRKVLPFILLFVLCYTLVKKDLGLEHLPKYTGKKEILVASSIGLTIGFYDGFFGPGTGSFFVFLFVHFLGYDFLHASASAKILNISTNLAALVIFGLKGHVWWHLAIPMALANILGSYFGTSLALRKGTKFVRMIFIFVVVVLIIKTGFDGFK